MTTPSNDESASESDDRLTEAAKGEALDASGSSVPDGETTETVRPEAAARIPKRVGQYHIKRAIGAGAMGTVFEATQERPRRTVALKLMNHGVASRSALRRFEYESQILARLRHPGIAQVYEAGTHRDDSGTVPFFAMEYIPNAKRITKYVREKGLNLRQKLELFAQVCDAVHHGHQKGIVHRDLKPGNILVDSRGEVKVIDFGVARGTDSDMAVTTLQTDFGQLIGTLQYMSPEQCVADPHDIDTRSDVYALGVVLYELVSGQLPYKVSRSQIYEATRTISEQEPRRLPTISRALRGDIETVVLKALEKDRDRRYQSADELRRDIEHYLKGESIAARPPSMVYQLRVFARRNKALVTGIVVAMLALTLGVIGTTIGLVQANRQRRAAATEAAKAQATLSFLMDQLEAVDPSVAGGQEVTIRSMLDETARWLDAGEFAELPEAEASLRATLGKTYLGFGLYNKAETQLRLSEAIRQRELGDEHPETLQARSTLASLLIERGEYAAAEELIREVLDTQRQVLGPSHGDTLNSVDVLATALWRRGQLTEAEALHRQTLEIRRRVLGAAHRDTLRAMYNLGVVLSTTGRFAEAETIHRQGLDQKRQELGDEHPDTLRSMSALATALIGQEHYQEAEEYLRTALQIEKRVLGDDHPSTAKLTQNLAAVLQRQDKFMAAEMLYREALAMKRRVFRDGHPSTLTTIFDLVDVLYAQGKTEEVRPFIAELVAGSKRAAEQPNIAYFVLNNYAWLLLTCEPSDLRDAEAALGLAKRAVDAAGAHKAGVLHTLALAYHMIGDIDKALETQRQAVRLLPAGQSPLRPYLETRLAALLQEKGDNQSAEFIIRGAVDDTSTTFGDRHARLVGRMIDLGIVLHARGRYRLYEHVCSQLASVQQTGIPQYELGIGDQVVHYAAALVEQERSAEAEELLRLCLDVRRLAYGEDDWRLAHVMSLLGASLTGQGKFDEAEPLLIDAYNQMQNNEETIPEDHRDLRLREALERIVKLYEDWGKPDTADEYRQARVEGR